MTRAPLLSVFFLAGLVIGCASAGPPPAPAETDPATVVPPPALATIVATPSTSAGRSPTPASAAADTSVPATPPRLSRPGNLTVNAVGDLMLARDITDLMAARGPVYPFEMVRPLLADADLVIANLEGTFTERGIASSKQYTFRTPPRLARGLADGGIGLVALANNHTMDFGRDGLADTLAALDAAGVRHAGAGLDEDAARQPIFIDVNGLRVAFLSYDAVLETTFAHGASPGVAYAELDSLRRDVAAARARADVVIVAMHAGTEYTDAPTQEQRAIAHAAIDAGALLVLGSHPHVLQGFERYKGGLIAYSLGNFVFDLDRDDLATLGPRPFQTAVLQVELTPQGVTSFTTRPVFIDPDQDRPLPADAEQRRLIEQRIAALNAGLP